MIISRKQIRQNVRELARRLHKVRRLNDISLKQAAKQTGISVPSLSRIERGGKMTAETYLILVQYVSIKDPQSPCICPECCGSFCKGDCLSILQ